MATIHDVLGGPRSIQAYGCVKCQRWHYEGDPDFEAHLLHQSKHGITLRPATEAADARKEREGD